MVGLIFFLLVSCVIPAIYFVTQFKYIEDKLVFGINLFTVVGFVLLAVVMFNFYAPYTQNDYKSEWKFKIIENPYYSGPVE